MKTRIMSFLLALVMVCSLIPMMTTTASATEYNSGNTVNYKSVAAGDTVRKGAIISNNSDLPMYVVEANLDGSFSDYLAIKKVGESWTADVNYYVVEKSYMVTTTSVGHSWVSGYTVHLYPITETSAITFNPSGGTIQGGTAAKTFTATKYLSDYCDVSWLTPSRPGCTFLGWYTSDGKEQVYNANGIAVNGTYWKNNLWQGQGAMSLIAKWQVNTSVTFRYHPNGGVGQPDNFVTWKATPSSSYPDNHWNYANSGDTYYMTRHGYTATGYYAKADGSCAYHQDDNFTSYADLCDKYGVSTTGEHTIDIYAQWSPNNYTLSFNADGGTVDPGSITAPYDSTITLPTPTRPGYNCQSWQGDLMDIATLTNGMEINDTSKGTIGPNASYAVTQDLIPVIGGMTYTSNYEVCGLYSFDANGNFIRRESSYATTHTVSANAAYVRIEVNVTKGISFDQYNSGLTLTYTVPAGTAFPMGGNQTLTARWSVASYTVNASSNTAEGGTVTGGGTFSYGTNVTLTATPNSDYRFVSWTENGNVVSTDATYTFTVEGSRNLVANFVPDIYTVTWKNYDGTVLETDTGLASGTTPEYNGPTPTKPEDEDFAYSFDGWEPEVSPVTGDVVYTAKFTAQTKCVEPTYTVTIPATAKVNDSFTISASNVVLNTNEILTITLTSDFILRSTEDAQLPFRINGGGIGNNAVVLSITGNGDKNVPLFGSSVPLTITADEPTYAGTYTGTIHFTIAVTTAGNN